MIAQKKIQHIVLTLIIFIFFVGVKAQENSNSKIMQVYLEWQTSNCGIDGDDRLIDQIRQNAEVIAPLLLKGFREGPPQDFITETVNNELQRLRQNRKTIESDTIATGLSAENLKIANELDLESLREQTKTNVVRGWQTRALSGLSYIREFLPKNFFEKLASDEENSFASLARFYLNKQ